MRQGTSTKPALSVPSPKLPAVLALGFRPFYLVAAAFAVVAVPLWVGSYRGLIPVGGYYTGIVWHTHEMLFGFVTAVMAGFLLTAVRNWTGRPTPVGMPLAVLVAVWVVARVLMFSGPGWAAALVDVAFLPLLIAALVVPIWQSRNVRNFGIVGILAVLLAGNLLFHLAHFGLLPAGFARIGMLLALDLITVLMAIIAGRVIPAFTASAVPEAQPRRALPVEVAALGLLVLVLLVDAVNSAYPVPGPIRAGLFASAAVAHLFRLFLWRPWYARNNPLLLMLPVAYAWIPIALALRAVSVVSPGVPESIAYHALTTGAMAGLMIAMMTRSSLGHTGRKLAAGPREITAFLLVLAAAVVRVFGPLLAVQAYSTWIVISALLWTAGFGVFLVAYWPILTRPRIDGKPG